MNLPATVFLSAFLLFQVQPIMGRFLLPWFGGTPATWTVCLLFFQSALLAGYAYAHWLGSRTNVRMQAIIHSALLAASLLFLPIAPSADVWKPAGGADPSTRILLMLTATVGGPYVLLAATAPLLQRWFSLSAPSGSPWRLYALSNFGSFLALLSYPVLFEPFLRLRTQTWIWAGLYVCFTAACAWTAWHLRPAPAASPAELESDLESAPKPLTIVFWILLAATGSTLLMATTSELSQEIAVSPFLWIAPLSIYLLTFVLAFASDRWYPRSLFAILAGILAPAACVVTTIAVGVSLTTQFTVYLAALFAACMVCHGELVWSKPSPRYLTTFYLCVAAGGALGGVFAAIVAPRYFTEFSEFPIAYSAACLLGFVGWLRSGAFAEWTSANIALRVSLMALLLGGVSSIVTTTGSRPPLAAVRNFYGILRVSDAKDPNGMLRQLTHGRIKHGFQYQAAPQREWPTSYFGPHSGIGVALSALTKPNLRIAVIGLGTGTIAAWGRPGDTIRFYEINPAVEPIARSWFTYLKDSKATVEVALGDARVELERELAAGRSQDFDVLAVDAFSSDSIPIHLLTAECADVYRRRLRPDGLLLLHISNRTLNLEPVVRGLAAHLGWQALMFASAEDPKTGEDSARWVLVTSNASFLAQPDVAAKGMGWTMPTPNPILWNDDFASLWRIFKW